MQRRVFITGGSRGIGEAIGSCYRDAGWKVESPSRQEMDLSSMESITAFLENSERADADVLINNAGINEIRAINELRLEDWQNVLMVNLTAPFMLIKHFAPRMAARGWGRIINISSCYSLVSKPGRAGYSASKTGLNGLTRAAALEFASAGVLVNAVCPGFIETDMTYINNTPEQISAICNALPIKRLGSREEVAAYVYFLGSDHNTYISGQIAVIDGGFITQ